MEKINVGLTIGFQGDDKNFGFWVNGARQNILYLYMTLRKSNLIDKLFIVNCGAGKIKDYNISSDVDTNFFNIVEWDDCKDNLDLVIEIGMQMGDDKVRFLKNKKAKIVSYRVGNAYILGTEATMYKRESGVTYVETDKFDECWTNSQHLNTNKYYWETLYRCPVKDSPHVWHPFLLEKVADTYKDIVFEYQNIEPKKRITILEPNINMVKTCIYPMIICDRLHNRNSDLIKSMMVTNTSHINKERSFVTLVKSLKLNQDKLASFEARYMTPYILGKYSDIVVTHQWENGLNYLYYDIFHFKYPLVHNSPFLKEYGYYYDGFNAEDGSKALEHAILYHDLNIKEYNKKCEEICWKHNAENPDVVKEYDDLIINLFSEIKTNYYREEILLTKKHQDFFYTTTINSTNYHDIFDEIQMEFEKNDTVLDVGCGDGDTITMMTKEYGLIADGVDLSYKRIEKAKEYNLNRNTNCNFYLQDIRDFLKKCDKKYNVITIFDTLKYIENPCGLINDLLPFLKDDGFIIADIQCKLKDYDIINFFIDENHIKKTLNPDDIYELQKEHFIIKYDK